MLHIQASGRGREEAYGGASSDCTAVEAGRSKGFPGPPVLSILLTWALSSPQPFHALGRQRRPNLLLRLKALTLAQRALWSRSGLLRA